MTSIIKTIAKQCDAVKAAHATKSKQNSAHTKIANVAQWHTAQAALGELTIHWRAMMPDHWQKASWGMTLTKDGQTIRWSAKNGASTKGLRFKTTPDAIAYATAYVNALATQQISFGKDQVRLNRYGMTEQLSPYLISVPTHTAWGRQRDEIHAIQGTSPTDAYANLIVSGLEKDILNKIGTQTPPDQAVDIRLRNQGRNWSASLFLFDSLCQNKDFRYLLKKAIPHPVRRSALIPKISFFDQEKTLHSILKALPGLGARERTQHFMVTTHGHDHSPVLTAWNPNSAILARYLFEIFCGKKQNILSTKTWKAYPLGEATASSLKL